MTDSALVTICILGRLLDDLERLRIMNGNRIGAAERESMEPLPHLLWSDEQLRLVESQAVLELKRAWRGYYLADWAAGIPGAGEKLMSRFIAAIGDPADRPNPGKLLAYCGHGDPARKRTARMTQEEAFRLGNPEAKKRLWLLSSQFVRTLSSPYRAVYLERREATTDRTHERSCARCGPSGHPALPGSPWSLGHRHADAVRVTGKRFVVDLWAAAQAMRVEQAA